MTAVAARDLCLAMLDHQPNVKRPDAQPTQVRDGATRAVSFVTLMGIVARRTGRDHDKKTDVDKAGADSTVQPTMSIP